MKKIFLALILVSLSFSCAFAEGLAVTTGAGYMKMSQELCAAYKAETGNNVQEMYGGNIGQMLAQIEAGSGVSILISDKGTLDSAKTNVKFEEYLPLGNTVLVLAWRKGVSISSPSDLLKDNIKSVCYPDPKAAIYGHAASKFLESSGIGAKISGKLSQVSTVPQVFSYLVSGEMDAGFVNRVVVRAGAKDIGGYLEITEGYPQLNMVAAVVQGTQKNKEVKDFLAFLKTAKAKEILKKHGVW